MTGKLESANHSYDWDLVFAPMDIFRKYLIPEHHWPALQKSSLSIDDRIRLNHFLTYFMCEMFIHFEKLIIQYMQFHRNKILLHASEKQIDRFIQEEESHIKGFESLAFKLRPDLFTDRNPRFLAINSSDQMVIRHTSMLPFFMMAALFEEMTLFIPTVMEENLDDSSAPVLELMRYHAKEEKSHIGIDRKIVMGTIQTQSKLKSNWEMQSLLPLVVYSNLRVENAWKKASIFFSQERGLTKKQSKEIVSKGLSKSDQMGMQSYIQKNIDKPILGNGILCFVLKQLLKWKGI